MKLAKIYFSKAELLSIPKKDLEFFIQLMNFFNEANILQKLMVISGNSREEASKNEVIARSLSSQGLFFMRIQAGKLYEGWNMLNTHFFNNKTFSQEYNKKGSSQSKKNLSKLKESFGRGNLLKKIRNIYAFHYSKESSNNMIKQIENAPDSEMFELYFSDEYGNCFLSLAHDLLNSSILEDIEPGNWRKAMNDLFQEILDITKYFLDFLQDCIRVIFEKYLQNEYEEIEILEPLSITDIKLPFFVKR